MAKQCLKKRLHEELNSSDEECLGNPSKQPHISSEKNSEYHHVVPFQEKLEVPSGHGTEIQDSTNGRISTEEFLPTQIHIFKETKSPGKPINDPSIKEASVTARAFQTQIQETDSKIAVSEIEISSTEAFNVGYIQLHDQKYTNEPLHYSSRYFTNTADHNMEVEEISTKDTSTKKQGKHSDIVDAVELSPKDASAKKLENEYRDKYASLYSRKLLFGVDVMTLVRHLNNLPFKWIIYATGGNQPKSPCTDIMDQALGVLWAEIKDKLDSMFENCKKLGGINYFLFQEIIVHIAEGAEKKVFLEKYFLSYCVEIAHWAVFAEINGVKEAVEFIPLVICRTIVNLRDSGKITKMFWKRLEEKSYDIIIDAGN